MAPRTVAHQASLSFTISQSWFKLLSIESVMPSNHLILCYPLLLQPSIFPSIRVSPIELALGIRWPTYSAICLPASVLTGLTSAIWYPPPALTLTWAGGRPRGPREFLRTLPGPPERTAEDDRTRGRRRLRAPWGQNTWSLLDSGITCQPSPGISSACSSCVHTCVYACLILSLSTPS